MKLCCKPSRMCEIRVSTGSLVATATALCVLSLHGPAIASQHDFIQLPQAFAQDCYSVHSRVQPVKFTGRVRPGADYKVSYGPCPAQPPAQSKHGFNPQEFVASALVPGQDNVWISDPVTTGSALFSKVSAALAAEDGHAWATPVLGENPVIVAPSSAAYSSNSTNNGDALIGLREHVDPALLMAANSVTKSDAEGSADQSAADDDKDAGQDEDDPKDGGKVSDEEFTGSPSQAGPDLSSTEEENLISNGWK